MRKARSSTNTLIGSNGLFTPGVLRHVESFPNTVLLETTKEDNGSPRSYLFCDPVAVIQCESLDAVESQLLRVEEARSSGYYAAGFVSYEAGYAFEKSLPPPPHPLVPFLWFGIYKHPLVYNHRTAKLEGKQRLRLSGDKHVSQEVPALKSVGASLDEADYKENVGRVQQYIVDGDTYQVNLTFKLKFEQEGRVSELYARLRNAQRVGYSAFIRMKNTSVLSFSPELFFRIHGNTITLRPMKGTAQRGRTLQEDNEQVDMLKRSEKNRAENLMIVDLLRNDVGRLAIIGSVKVPRFFDIEKYDTVFQATSTIQAKLRENVTALELMRCLFPSGSVTGAPKIRTMQIIRELEREPRGVYTGAIGFFAPGGASVFNVAIRTVVLDHRSKTAEMGIGSGIVHDSTARDEYQECLLKARFLTEPAEDFRLLETLRWDPGRGWWLLRDHLRRLKESASYFDFAFVLPGIMTALKKREKEFRKGGRAAASRRVRLELERDGSVNLTVAELNEIVRPVSVTISEQRTSSQDRFLFHKTTSRRVYDRSLSTAEKLGIFDVLFLNERDELTEGARSNLIVRKGERYFTPPVSCGLLPGVYRSYLMRSRKLSIEEKVLYQHDLADADEVFLCNSVRGMVNVRTVDSEHHIKKRKETTDAKLLVIEN